MYYSHDGAASVHIPAGLLILDGVPLGGFNRTVFNNSAVTVNGGDAETECETRSGGSGGGSGGGIGGGSGDSVGYDDGFREEFSRDVGISARRKISVVQVFPPYSNSAGRTASTPGKKCDAVFRVIFSIFSYVQIDTITP